MPIDAYVIQFNTLEDEDMFLSFMLNSPDFSREALRSICKTHGLISSGTKGELADRIRIAAQRSLEVRNSIVQNLITRSKPWAVFKLGDVVPPSTSEDPLDLLVRAGEAKWYGPIYSDHDSTWYVRPVFIPHWESIEGFDGPQETKIRWLFFARIGPGVMSYHWRGFSYTADVENVLRPNAQFPYWQHVPELIAEFENLTQATSLRHVELHDLILHGLWEHYRYRDDFDWRDLRIRAEAGGVSLSARASAAVEIDIPGIRRLANTIRRSIDRELSRETGSGLPDSDRYDEVVLRTIIRELGALSYEFDLEEDGRVLFRGHAYFGMKPGLNSPDAFAHINLHTSSRPELEQLTFLLDFMAREHEPSVGA